MLRDSEQRSASAAIHQAPKVAATMPRAFSLRGSFVRDRLGLSLAALALSCVGCGGSSVVHRTDRPKISMVELRREIQSAKVARRLPIAVRRACERARSKATVEVRCPQLAPGGGTTGEVLFPRRSRPGGPGAPGDAGVLRYRSSRAIYALTFMSSGFSGHHWMVAGGRTAEVTSQFLRLSQGTRRSPPRVMRYAGRTVRLVRYPAYPAGGMNGGHIVASTVVGDMTYVASVHGYTHQDLAIGLLMSMVDAP